MKKIVSRRSILFFLFSIIFLIFCAFAGVEIWWSLLNIALSTDKVGIINFEPQYDHPDISLCILLAVVLCYVLFVIFLIKIKKQNLMFIGFIISLVFFFNAPRAMVLKFNVENYFHKVSIESNFKFIDKIQTEINNRHISSYLIDFKASKERVKEFKTRYVVVLVKDIEGVITKDEVLFFLDAAKDKKFKNVDLLFYDKAKADSITIDMDYKNGITYCSPNDKCEDFGIKEDE
ncbi:hypothetical protein [Paenibacillus etheri]|uniref:Uncharacterized protein n=1 Tax=Paenibacillus etheri TaxID=1306852 RepID=A0A0W1AWE0_9BACL|nr:hypothetical protein [Paenibacillus etheri]KTD85643.1 hypothetical protein UQ64_19305 [Paenibacillus etheri]